MTSLNIQHKRCLIVGVETLAGWNDYNRRYITRLLGNSGIQCEPYVIVEERRMEQLEFLCQRTPHLHERYDFVVTTNRFPANLGRIEVKGEMVDFYSQCRVPVLSWYVDNVAHHMPSMTARQLPQEVPLLVDRCSISSLRQAVITEQPKIFLPMWGPERAVSYLDSGERPIPVVFTGDIHPLTELQNIHEELKNSTTDGIDILLAVIEEMRDDKGTRDAFHLCLEKAKSAGIPESAVPIFRVADRWLRTYRRKAVLQRIKKTPVVVLGDVHDPELAAQTNIEVRGRIRVEDGEPIMRQAKILLGDFANFVEGIELRPAMANVNGCVLACEPNTFMKREVPAPSYIDLLSGGGAYDDILEAALGDEDRLVETSRVAADHYDAQLKRDLFSFG